MKSTAKLAALLPTKEQIANYTNAVIVVNNYAYAIVNQQMPVLNYPPDNYAKFTTSFMPAKQHVLNWSDNIYTNMVVLPQTITNLSSSLFDLDSELITSYLQILVGDPTNKFAKTHLQTGLKNIQSVANNVAHTITNIQNELNVFDTNIIADSAILSKIATDALAAAGADKDKIAQINEDIQNLNNKIAAMNNMITVSEMIAGISIFVAIIGVLVCTIPGAQTVGAGLIIVGVAGVATGIGLAVTGTNTIAAAQALISEDNKQIDGLNQDIIQLKAMSTQFKALHTANAKAQTALDEVIKTWKNLGTLIGDVITELTDAETEATSADYEQALGDFNNANTIWGDVVQFATTLAGVKIMWQNTDKEWVEFGSLDKPVTPDSGYVNSLSA